LGSFEAHGIDRVPWEQDDREPDLTGIGPYPAVATVQVGSAPCHLAVETCRRGSVRRR
jgi:hypothetical protein